MLNFFWQKLIWEPINDILNLFLFQCEHKDTYHYKYYSVCRKCGKTWVNEIDGCG